MRYYLKLYDCQIKSKGQVSTLTLDHKNENTI